MLTLTLALALAQPPAQPQGTVASEQTFRVKNVLGAQVMVASNTRVGTIEDLVFDQAGTIEYAIVSDQGKLVTVPWQAIQWGGAAATATATTAVTAPMVATVAIPVEKWRTIPTYTTTAYPTYFAPAYRTQVYQYYGLTPHERRVLNRIGR